MHIYIYIYIHIHTHMYMCIYIYIYTYIHYTNSIPRPPAARGRASGGSPEGCEFHCFMFVCFSSFFGSFGSKGQFRVGDAPSRGILRSMYVCMYVCVYVYIYIYMYISTICLYVYVYVIYHLSCMCVCISFINSFRDINSSSNSK